MKRLKLAVCIAFIITFGSFALFRSDSVTGQTGGSAISAPTGLVASDNAYANKVGLYWDTIRGANVYRIFRSSVNDSATGVDIGTTAQNTFLDASAPAGQIFFYWVRAENGDVVSGFSAADQGSRAVAGPPGPVPPINPPPVPLGNPITATKVYLGKTLFWDEQMSSTRTVSCGTCHHSATGGTDARTLTATAASTNPGPNALLGDADDIVGSQGVPSNNADGTYVNIATYGLNSQVTGRKTVSYVNAAYAPLLFWDGRASNVFRDPLTNAIILNNGGALESQILGPPVSSAEMGHAGRDWNDVAARITASKPLALVPVMPTALSTWINGRTYPELFQEAFGTPDVTPSRIALAIATFERTLYGDQTPFDKDAAGITPLTGAEQRGRGIFNAPGSNCNVCHAGSLFSDNTFRYIGVRPQTDDTGRFQQTGNNQDLGAFRVPSLRNVGLRQSYFHNGRFSTLEQVVAFYNRGGDFNAPNKPPLIHPLGLNGQQQADLVAFLRNALTDPRVTAENERFDRPTLYMESSRVPQITGTGRAGSGGITPTIKAISPPIVGNPNFTVSVSGAMGNAPAVLVIDSVDPGIGTIIPASGAFPRVTATTQNTGAGNGWASVSVAIPDSAAVVGQNYFARWYVQDADAANGFSVSQAAQFTVFGQSSVASNFSVSGRVTTPDGRGLRNVTVTLSNSHGASFRVTTSSFGFYSFDGVSSTGGTFNVAVSSRLYRFATQNVVLTSDLANLDFVGLE